MTEDGNTPPPGWLMAAAAVLILAMATAGILIRLAWDFLAWLAKLA